MEQLSVEGDTKFYFYRYPHMIYALSAKPCMDALLLLLSNIEKIPDTTRPETLVY
jgi:hypothetical protein